MYYKIPKVMLEGFNDSSFQNTSGYKFNNVDNNDVFSFFINKVVLFGIRNQNLKQ
jgi:hypothetical protein